MKQADLDLLHKSVDKEVELEFTNGEIAVVKIVLVSDEDQDVIFHYVPQRDKACLEKWDRIAGVRTK
jgi:hypothetical protein